MDKAELRRMSQAERRDLARLLAELDEPPPGEAARADPYRNDPYRNDAYRNDAYRNDPYRNDPVLRRERRLALIIAAACCVILAGWIVVLAATLPHHFDAHHWRALWVNFDVFLLVAFAATAWAIWRERQVLILLLVLIGTMLCCDAWFDVGTSLATGGFWISLLSAVFAEVPLAILAFVGARRLLKATVSAAAGASAPIRAAQVPGLPQVGSRGRSCAEHSLRRTPLAGTGLDEALPRTRAEWRADREGRKPA